MFYFFYKIIIFIVNKEKDNIRSAYCKFLQLGDKPHCSRHFHASRRYENTLVDQSKRTYYANYFITLNNIDKVPALHIDTPFIPNLCVALF